MSVWRVRYKFYYPDPETGERRLWRYGELWEPQKLKADDRILRFNVYRQPVEGPTQNQELQQRLAEKRGFIEPEPEVEPEPPTAAGILGAFKRTPPQVFDTISEATEANHDINATDSGVALANRHGLNLNWYADKGSGKGGRIYLSDVRQWISENELAPLGGE
ncbi:MAG: hypothetical protein ACE5H0_09145 [Bacteroidota bacterium]